MMEEDREVRECLQPFIVVTLQQKLRLLALNQICEVLAAVTCRLRMIRRIRKAWSAKLLALFQTRSDGRWIATKTYGLTRVQRLEATRQKRVGRLGEGRWSRLSHPSQMLCQHLPPAACNQRHSDSQQTQSPRLMAVSLSLVTLSINSLVWFTCGYSILGTSLPKSVHSGSHPCVGGTPGVDLLGRRFVPSRGGRHRYQSNRWNRSRQRIEIYIGFGPCSTIRTPGSG